jgi:hypothetical protein
MKLIESKTLGTAAASIEFTSIPQDATDLYFLFSFRSSTNVDYIGIAFNGSTSNFTFRQLTGDGSVAGSGSGSDNLLSATTVQSSYTANTFSNCSLYIPNYTSSNNKSFSMDTVLENNSTATQMTLKANLWSNTAAITSVTFTAQAGANFVAGSTASLYGITKGSDGIVTTS